MAYFDHCGATFPPNQIIRLYASEDVKRLYPYQDLMIGACDVCGHTVMQWQGVDEYDIGGQVYPIRPKHFDKWMIRTLSDAVQDLNTETSDWVWGSNPEFPYELRKVLVIPQYDALTGNEVTQISVDGELEYCA